MHRNSRRYVLQFVIFVLILLLIIYLGTPSPATSQTRYAWEKIRYRTSARAGHLLGPSAVCTGLADSQKPALVVASVSADKAWDWLQPLETKFHVCIYTADAVRPVPMSKTPIQTPANKGHEAMAYLSFIIDNYDTVPQTSVFVHGSKFSWHNDHPTYSNLPLLMSLNVTRATEDTGYHSLRCDWQASTCDPHEGKPQGSLEKAVNAKLEPWNARDVSDSKLPKAFAILFGDAEKDVGKVMLSRTETVRSQCCAQFVVSKQSIHQHTLEEYIALRRWLLDDGVAPDDDKISGRILSYLWHILFIKHDPMGGINLEHLNELACPSAEQCYCRLYGRCELEGCTSFGRCHGQYQVPVDFKLPPGWEERYA